MAGPDTDREWRLLTVPFWQADARLRKRVLLGEVPLRTDLTRRIDAVAIKREGRGGEPAGPFYLSGRSVPHVERSHWLGQIPGADVIAIQTKIEPIGFSVLGQTLVSTLLLPTRYEGCRATGIALGTATDADLERVLPSVSKKIEIAALPVAASAQRPRREYRPAPELLDQVETHLRGLHRVSQRIRLTAFESAEALFVFSSRRVRTIDELRGRDVVIVHTIDKATNLPVVGHAVFSAALIKEHRPRSVRSIIVSRASDAPVEAVATSFGVEMFHATQFSIGR